jgi:transposase-like protein
MGFPKTLREFQAIFPDEEACWRALRRARWPRGFECPRCGHRRSSWISTRALEQCRSCRYQCSITAGTVFHRTRVPLLIWFWAIFFVARHKKGISALQLQRDAGLRSYQTAWTLLHRIRSTLAEQPGRLLSGLVEADETFLGARNERGAPGRTRGKPLVAIAVENRGNHAGSLRLSHVPDASQAELGPFVRGAIDTPETTVRTDGWWGYGDLAEHGARHQRRVQPTRRHAVKLLPWSHTVASNLKTWLRGTFHGVSKKHLPLYLNEFSYRFNRRWREAELFGFVLRRAAIGEPLPYARLIADQAG